MIKDTNIVLSGGSSGIGRSILELLAAERSNRILVACRTAEKITGFGDNVIPFSCDLSGREGVDALFEKIGATFDKCGLFIANAGAPYYEKYDYVNWDRVQHLFGLNTLAPIYMFTKYMEHLAGREGRIVYTISAMGEMAIPGYALYTSTKFAMKGFQQAVRLEAPDNLKITCVYPVSTKTNFFNVGTGGVDVGQPFPVQTAEKVAKITVRGIEKGKKQIYPCRIFRPSRLLMDLLPPVRSFYWHLEKKRLERFLTLKEQKTGASKK